MEKFLKKAGWTSILTSLVLAVIGIVMIYNPQTTMQFISTILGIFFIVMGIIKLINYFVTKGNSSLFTNDIAWGIISICYILSRSLDCYSRSNNFNILYNGYN